MKTFVTKSFIVSMALCLVFAGTVVRSVFAGQPISGAVFTTESICNGTNLNIFTSKDAVYLDGGPEHQGAAGLPDGSYYVKVTTPNGNLLGTSIGSGNDAPVHVTNGSFDKCYQLSAILIKNSDHTVGYDTTTNNGGEYKVWASTTDSFDNDATKTDNFKVNESPTPTPTTEPCANTICVTPTATPSATPTATPTNTPSNGGSDNGGSSNNSSSNSSSQPTQAVLAASTMAETGTFSTTVMNFMLVAGMMIVALGAKSYAKEKNN